MTFAKLIDGELVIAPKIVHYQGCVVINPDVEKLTELGYKPVTYTEPPQMEPGYVAVPGWEEQADEIVQTWGVEPEPDEIDDGRAYRIIVGEEE